MDKMEAWLRLYVAALSGPCVALHESIGEEWTTDDYAGPAIHAAKVADAALGEYLKRVEAAAIADAATTSGRPS